MELIWFRFEYELVLQNDKNETNLGEFWDLLVLAYETYTYTLLHTYVSFVYTWLRHSNLFGLFC